MTVPDDELLEGSVGDSVCDTDVDCNESGIADLIAGMTQKASKGRSNAIKRKASPLSRAEARRTTTARKSKGNQLYSDSLVHAFKNPSLIETIAPLLQSIMNPAIQTSI